MTECLTIESLQFSRGEHVVLKDVFLSLKQGEMLSLMGESGGGKTTLLRLIAGLENMQQGSILLQGNVIASSAHHTPPQKRNMGMVFQAPSLFPHVTIEKNIAFGVSKIESKLCAEMVHDYAKKVGMERYLDAYPDTLSGGQQQRVALARALICKPKLMLLDEPFSSLDSDARNALREEVKALLKEEKMTSILVTHDETEAHLFADRVLYVKDHKLV